jgi:hypothetical protein
MSKSFGDAFVVDVSTKMIRLLMHYPTRALLLSILLLRADDAVGDYPGYKTRTPSLGRSRFNRRRAPILPASATVSFC